MSTTSIEWTDASWNPVVGCRRVSPGCQRCYAERLAGTRLRNHPAYKGLTRGRYDEMDAKWTGEVRLLQIPAAVRFLSVEPMLEGIDLRHLQPGDPPTEIDALSGTHGVLRPHRGRCERIDWVIFGGESGPGARPCDIEWIRDGLRQCRAAGVAAFVKQLGALPLQPKIGDGWRGHAVIESQLALDMEWPEGTRFGNLSGIREINGRQALLSDRKGGDMSEWPEYLRVREIPESSPKARQFSK